MPTDRSRFDLPLAGLRVAVAIAVVAAVTATTIEAASRVRINPFNLFGYFTIQSNLLLAGVLLVLGLGRLAGRPAPAWETLARAACTTYIVVVGLVYAVLLAPLDAAGGVPVPWANTVLHVVTPLFGVADWFVAPSRHPLPWRATGWILVYPVVWLAVVLVRGATDGWVPYPFLDPERGYGQITVAAAGIAVVFTALALLTIAWSSRAAPRH